MAFLSKYGVARHIYINVPKAGSANHAVSADWTPAAGDVKISKDGGAAANVTNLPVAIAMGNSATWDFSITATEMQAAQINITVSDSATKAVDDTGFVIETYGNASGQHAFDLGTASTAQTGDNYARLGAPAGASVSADIAAIKAETATILADTNDIQTRLPAALVGGRMDSNVGAISADATAADNLEAALDGTGGVTITAALTGAITGSLSGSVGSVTGNVGGNVTGTIGGLTAAALKDFFDTDSTTTYASAVAGSVVKEIVDNVASGSGLDAAGVRAAIGLASANLDTQLSDIHTKTTNLPSDPADQSLIIAATDAVMSRLGAPAGASHAADVAAVKSDTAATKAKTDSLTFTVAGQVDANIQYVNDIAVTGNGQTGTEWGP
jgi:hypothetical protein